MWTLILVFTLTSNTHVAVATSEIPGFSTRQTCVQAGAAVPGIKRYVCVEVK